MSVLRAILLASLPAGLVAGAALSLVQIPFVLPLVHEAETYERGMHAQAPPAESETDATVAPQRLAFTVVSNLLLGIAGGLLLVSAMILRAENMDARRGVLWGLAAFTAFALAPALGLPPELPGTEAAPLAARQGWWVFTVAATAGGLALLFRQRSPYGLLLGVALLALPHLLGAPHPEHAGGTAPEALARAFVRASLLASFLFWIVLGAASGHLLARSMRE